MSSRSKRIMQDVVALMRSAGIRPELIYAYQKTGFLLDEAGYRNLSPEDRAAYDDAVEEYLVTAKGPL